MPTTDIRRIRISAQTQAHARCAACGDAMTRAYSHHALKGLYCSPACIEDGQRRVDLLVPAKYHSDPSASASSKTAEQPRHDA